MRRLIEETPLTYGEIAKRTGVGRASICRWTRDEGWRRHVFAPRATDTVPRSRAPRAAVEDFLANREPPPAEPGRRRPRRPTTRAEYHAWLLQKER